LICTGLENFILLVKVHFNVCLVNIIDILCSKKLERPLKGELKCYVGVTVIQTCGLTEIVTFMDKKDFAKFLKLKTRSCKGHEMYVFSGD
jgi:hypothetical protein